MAAEQIRIDVFGGLRPLVDGAPRASPTGRSAAVLAFLLLARREPVSAVELVGWVWGDDQPPSAANQLQRVVGQLRRLFEPDLEPRSRGSAILGTGSGYRLGDAVASDLFDLGPLAAPDRLEVVGRRPFAGLEAMLADHPWYVALHRHRVAVAVEALASPTIAVVDRAEALAADFPYDEALHAALIEAMARVGRRPDALAHYTQVRTVLRQELGIEPGPALRDAHESALHQEPDARGASSRRDPSQLPRLVGGFVRRIHAQAQLDRIAADGEAGAVLVTAIGGMGGVGKTSLAVAWAHQLAPRFPDGQLYLNLRGFDVDGNVLRSEDAIATLLRALDTAPAEDERTVEALSARLRSTLAGRRCLLLLDNARDAEQVRPLLPGDPGCLAIVTSRDRLGSLVIRDGAVPVNLDLMPGSEARELLERRLGSAALAHDPAATEIVLGLCGGLPLALSIVATRLALDPALTLTDLSRELLRTDATWSRDTGPDGLHTVFAWSYDALDPETARAFRLVAVHPGAEMSLGSVASLLGLDATETWRRLRELCDASLLQQVSRDRYALHDLLRVYALGLPDVAGERLHAAARLVDHVVQSLRNAIDTFGRPHPRDRDPLVLGVVPAVFSDPMSTVDWYAGERETIDAVLELCLEQGRTHAAVTIVMDRRPVTMGLFSQHDNARLDARLLAQPDADEETLGTSLLADLLRDFGTCLFRAGDLEAAGPPLERAEEMLRDSGDLITHCAVLRNLGDLQQVRGDHAGAAATLQRAADIAREAGSAQLLAAVHYSLVELNVERHDDLAALDAAATVLSLAEEHRLDPVLRIVTHVYRMGILGRLGRHDEALADVTAALAAGAADTTFATSVYLNEAYAAFRTADRARAARAVADFERATEPGSAELFRGTDADDTIAELDRLDEVVAWLGLPPRSRG